MNTQLNNSVKNAQQQELNQQKNENHSNLSLKETLEKLPQQWRFTPVNGNKQPYKNNWQNNPLNATEMAKELKNSHCKGIGVLCGTPSGGLLFLDHDGGSATQKILELSGCETLEEALPPTVGFTSGKDGRFQYIYQIPEEYFDRAKTRKIKTGVKSWSEIKQSHDEEQVELRWNGSQSVIAGQHPETGAYYWLEGQAPWEIDVALAPDWIVKLAIGEIKAPKTPKDTTSNSEQTEFNFSEEASETKIETEDKEVRLHSDSKKALYHLKQLDPKRADDYDQWVEVGMALHYVASKTNDDLLMEWAKWSSQSEKFAPKTGEFNEGWEVCCDKWSTFDAEQDGVTLASLIYWANEDNKYLVPSNHSLEAVVVNRVFAENWVVIDDSFYQYQENKGYWKHIPDPKVKRLLTRELEKFYRLKADKEGNLTKQFTYGTENNKNHCFKYAQSYLTLEERPSNRHLLAFKNGTVDLRTGQLEAHKKDNYLIHHIPLDYELTDNIPVAFYEFIKSSYGEEQLQLIRAIFSMYLDPTAPYGKFCHFIGPSGSGKGTMIRLIKGLTESSRSLTDFAELATAEGRHQHLTGVSIAVAPDCGGYINNLRAFYEMVDNGSMSGRALFSSHGYEKRWDVRFAIASVDHLQIENAGDGWKRRCIPIPTKGSPEKPDPTLETRLHEERGSIIGWALSMPKTERDELLFNSDLWSSQSQEKMSEQDIYSDSIRAFLDLCFRPTDDANASIDDGLMYDYYRSFCAVSGFKAFNINKFKSHLKGVIPFSRVSGKKTRVNGKEIRLSPVWTHLKAIDGVFKQGIEQIECNKYRQCEGGLEDIKFFAKKGYCPTNDFETVNESETVTETAETATTVSAKSPVKTESQSFETAETVRQGKSFADAKNIEYTFTIGENNEGKAERKLLGCRSVSTVSESQKVVTEQLTPETAKVSQPISVTVSMVLSVSDEIEYMGRKGKVLGFNRKNGYPLIEHEDGAKLERDPVWVGLLQDDEF